MPAMTIEPMATTVAGEEPETAANSIHAITEAIARPPGRCPTVDTAKSIIRRATPPVVRKLPARMKNGIASSVNCSMVWKNFRISDARLSLAKSRIVSSEDRPSAIAIGMPMMRRTNSATNRNAVVIGRPPSRQAFRRG